MCNMWNVALIHGTVHAYDVRVCKNEREGISTSLKIEPTKGNVKR